MMNVSLAEEALSLSPEERAELARLLIQSLEGDARTHAEIRVELKSRQDRLVSSEDRGLDFDEVFGPQS